MIKKSLVWLYSATTYLLWAIVIIVATVVLALRYVVLPNVDEYKDRIAQRISETAGQKVTIGDIQASWNGMQPHLDLHRVVLYDLENRPALTLDHIETSFSWLSLPLAEPRLASLVIHQPQLTIRRETDGTIYVAGIPMGGPQKSATFPNWLLRQSRIDVHHATVVWQDDARAAPPLKLEKLSLVVYSPAWESFRGHHRFGLRAQPSAGASQPIDIRGDVFGDDVTHPENWHGTVYARLEGTDIAAWRTWIDLPIDVRAGTGATQLWLDFAEKRIDKAVADVVLAKVVAPLGPKSPATAFQSLTGRLSWNRTSDGQELKAENLRLRSEGLNMQNGMVRVRHREAEGQTLTEGSIRLDEISLQQLAAFARHVPLSDAWRQRLNDIAPTGKLHALEFDWRGPANTVETFDLRSRFTNVSSRPYRSIPGFAKLSGRIEATEKKGELTLAGTNVQLEFKDILRWPIPADKLNGRAEWVRKADVLEIRLADLNISSPHLAGNISGTYRHTGKGRGHLDLEAQLTRADGKYARFYYPMMLSPATLHWLDTAILGGRGEDVDITVRGNLDHFPWADSKDGLFQVAAKISNGTLHYADNWPPITGIKLDMLFKGNAMELNAREGHLLGNQIIQARAVIPALNAPHPELEVTGELQSPAAEILNYINSSPLLEATDRFTEHLRASGNGKLLLGLRLPLDTDGAGTRVKGSYLISNGVLEGDGELPRLEAINGRLDFTETTLRAQNVNARIYGGPAQFSLERGQDGLLRITAQGRIDEHGIREAVQLPLADRLQGSTDWTAEILKRDAPAEVTVKSSLAGLAIRLPAPLNKNTADAWPLVVEKKPQNEQQEHINISLGTGLNARFVRTGQNGALHVERGAISFGGNAEIPAQRGIAVHGELNALDIDQWQKALHTDDTAGAAPPPAEGSPRLPELASVDLAVGTLDIFSRRIHDLKLDAKSAANGWQANLQSREVNGNAQWIRGGNGKIIARLKSLIVPDSAPAKMTAAESEDEPRKEQKYPALDVVADNFEFRKKQLGRLELIASQQNVDWNIEKLVIGNPDSMLSVSGVWHSWKRRPNTRLNVTWNINDIGKTMNRFGYPDTIRGGIADLKGDLRWSGSPHEFAPENLSGTLQLDAKSGQFLKIRPGVGRLLGVLSLQSLPRRLAFDFRDIFSAGFSFDRIAANVRIDDGIMRSDDFMMEGPAAKVEISGETNLAQETQNLHIKVTPSLSDSLSMAAFAGGPAVGVAAIVAQKLLNDPLNKLVAYEYDITGTWDDPQEVSSRTVPREQTGPIQGQ